LKGGTDNYREHTDTIIFISGRNERRLKIDVSVTSHTQTAFVVAKAYICAVSPGVGVRSIKQNAVFINHCIHLIVYVVP
jgi:hypothetical protein